MNQGIKKPLPPFSCTHSPDLPELINKLKCTIAISTYQAGKVILISSNNGQKLVQLPRNFKKAMGMAINEAKMAIATQNEVVILKNTPQLAPNYPKQPNTYDALFVPRSVFFTGEIDIHDLEWVDKKLLAVNTRFSCLSLINDDYSFEPVWKPSFITKLTPDDRCHLNGVALQNSKPKYVSALGKSDESGGWRANKLTGGIIMDVDTNEIVAANLPMPHSPRIYDGKLFVLLSATGELVNIDVQSGNYNVVKKFNGFVRGMDRHGDYLFIGLSKIRTSSSSFADMPIAKKSIFSGVVILHLPTNGIVGYVKYENSVEEIYDVKIIKGPL